MTILVTGATGLVGARLLPRLVERGEDCRALMRGGKQAPAGVTTFEGELLDPGSLVDAVQGIRAVIHHRDIAQAMTLALAGAMDSRVVNLADDAPTSIYELAQLVGEPVEPSSGPLANPWYLHVDGSLARRLGFQPTVRTVHQAAHDGLM